jgi:hypothetical protein
MYTTTVSYTESQLRDRAEQFFFTLPGISADEQNETARQGFLRTHESVDIATAIYTTTEDDTISFMLTVGEPQVADSAYETLLADLWANAYLEAARIRLFSEISASNLIWQAPGMGSLPIQENSSIAKLLNADEIGIKVLSSGTMHPTKTISGILTLSDQEKNPPNSSCNSEGCLFCMSKDFCPDLNQINP